MVLTLFSVSRETNNFFPSTRRRRNKKFFGAAVFQKCCRGILRGEQPLIFCVAKRNATAFPQKTGIKNNIPSIALLKISYRIWEKAARGRWTVTQASWGCPPALPAAFRPFDLEEIRKRLLGETVRFRRYTKMASLGNLVRAVRRIRFAVRLCPLSAIVRCTSLQSFSSKYYLFPVVLFFQKADSGCLFLVY